jgi:hypothetical protein
VTGYHLTLEKASAASIGLVKSRTNSVKSFTIGLNVRFFRVTITTGHGRAGRSTDNIAAPVKVGPPIIARVGDAVRKITEFPDVQSRMLALGYDIDFRSADKFRELIVGDYHKYGAIARRAGIQPN